MKQRQPSSTQRKRASISTVKKSNPFKKIIIAIICITMLLIAIAVGFSIFYHPEDSVKSHIDDLARHYYEDFIYQSVAKANDASGITTALSEYSEHGLSRTTLRQLLLHDPSTDPNTINLIRKYCDENKTTVKFYPEPPYHQSSFHFDFTYSCNF